MEPSADSRPIPWALGSHPLLRLLPSLRWMLWILNWVGVEGVGLGWDRVVRGPYLQSMTHESVVIRWRTDSANQGVVLYGTSLDAMTNRAAAAGEFTEHIVGLTGLRLNTRYYYAVGTSETRILAGGTFDYSFVTYPQPGPTHPLRVWAVGDPGTANKDQRVVRDSFYEWAKDRPPDLWLMLGDNAYTIGTDKQYQKAVFEMYDKLLRSSCLWPTLGNHDAGSANSDTQSGVYFDVFSLPTLGQAGGVPSGTEAFYAFDCANIHFVCLDSEGSDRSSTGAMARWLKADLESTRQDWVVTFFHHPPYSKGSHDSDNPKDSGGRLRDMREKILPILEEGGVDLVLCGHSHSYERSYLLDGHYDVSTNLVPKRMIKNAGDGRLDGNGAYVKPAGRPPHEGAVYVVAGSSGQVTGGKLNHPVMYVSVNKLGSIVLDFNGLELDLTFLGDRGQRHDYFTLRKH